MTNIAILGAVWGDEGKGHITHHLSRDYDWVIRFNGGANAGHTIYRDGVKFVHNLLPSVDFRVPHIKAYLGSGMVIDLEKLVEEVCTLEKHYPGAGKRICVDREAFLVEDKHKEEDRATNGHIGSTNRGIGPAYKDKISRCGQRVNEAFTNSLYTGYLYSLISMGVNFVHQLEVESEMKEDNLLFEGAQGVMLDINHGIYPYVSCSDCTVGGIYSSGFGFAKLDKVYGVAKCYTTKVGEGPFPSEILGDEAEALRQRGQEFGATTGRPRRVGWLDLPALKYAVKKSGINSLIMTKFDILNHMEHLKVCYYYQKEPVCPADFFTAIPTFMKVSSWKDSKDPDQIAHFLAMVELYTNCKVEYISCGTSPEDIKQI